jgi:ABC-type Fe3+-hydroxamate transport system substrate-binding protein
MRAGVAAMGWRSSGVGAAALLACALLLLAGWAGCRHRPEGGRAPAPPGRPIPRMVALSPAIARTLQDLSLGALVVGRHGWDKWTDQSLPVCGDQAGIDYEALLSVRPTHVLLQRSDIPARLAELATENGWQVVNYPSLTLDDIRTTTRGLWDLAGVHRRHLTGSDDAPLARIQSEMDRAWSRRPGIDGAKVGRVLMLTSASPAYALGPGSFHQQILERLGGMAAITEGSPYITLDAEDVLGLRPDAIVLFLPREPGERARVWEAPALREALGPLGGLDVPAVARGRVAVIDHPMGKAPCTAMIEVADELARILEGWSRSAP